MSFYSPLFSIDVEHVFWNGPTVALTCVATPETADWMRRRDLLVRPQRNGLAVFCEASRRQVVLDDCTPGEVLLGFKWYTQDPLFSQYTLPLTAQQESLPYASSVGSVVTMDKGGGVQARYRLHSGEFVDAAMVQAMTMMPLARHLDARDILRKPVLVAQIDLADHVAVQADGTDAAGVDYYVRFSVRKSVWKYYFISDASVDAASLVVVDLDDAVRFVAAADEFFPGNRRALVFVSDREIDMQQKYPQRFQLREQGGMGERVLIRRLPNADVGKVTQEMTGSRAVLISEIYIN